MLPALGYRRALEGSVGAPHTGDFTEAPSLVRSVSVDRVMEQLARAHLKGFKDHITGFLTKLILQSAQMTYKDSCKENTDGMKTNNA